MFAVIMRTLLAYFFLIAAMRFTGKRQIGQMQLSELITAFLLSELAAIPITDLGIPIIYALFPISLIIALEISIPYLANKFPMLKKIVDGVPSIIINKGKINEKELGKLRMGIDELLCELRLKDVSDISEVEYAILEENGQLSIFPKARSKPLCAGDMNIEKAECGISHALIIDGRISNYNTKLTGISEDKLRNMIADKRIEDILLLTVDDCGNLTTIMKEKAAKKEKQNKNNNKKGKDQV